MFLFPKSNSILGLDIGTANIKAVQLKKDSDRTLLESYGVVNVMYPTDSQIKFDVVKQTANILKALHERAGFAGKRAVLSIPSNMAFVSILYFSPMPAKEMQKSVEYQAKKYIPIPISDVNLGWQILEEAAGMPVPDQKDVISKVKVLLTAVPKNVVTNYLTVAELAGYEVVALEIESLSLIRSLVDPAETGGILIVDIGAKATILSFVSKGHLLSTRHLTLGGDTITTSIANSLGISLERAEQMKRTAFGPNAGSPAVQIIKNTLELIRGEVQQFIRMIENQNQNKRISKIILTGGGSRMPGLANLFSSMSPIVEHGDSLKKLSYAPQLNDKLQELAPQLAVAIGLALRSDAT